MVALNKAIRKVFQFFFSLLFHAGGCLGHGADPFSLVVGLDCPSVCPLFSRGALSVLITGHPVFSILSLLRLFVFGHVSRVFPLLITGFYWYRLCLACYQGSPRSLCRLLGVFICLFAYSFIHLFICFLFIYLFVYVFIYSFIYLFIHSSGCIPAGTLSP